MLCQDRLGTKRRETFRSRFLLTHVGLAARARRAIQRVARPHTVQTELGEPRRGAEQRQLRRLQRPAQHAAAARRLVRQQQRSDVLRPTIPALCQQELRLLRAQKPKTKTSVCLRMFRVLVRPEPVLATNTIMIRTHNKNKTTRTSKSRFLDSLPHRFAPARPNDGSRQCIETSRKPSE
jgi:hypothetical protein